MIDKKLESLGISLPSPPKPAGSYIPVVVSKNMAYVSGQIPIQDGKIIYKGKVPNEEMSEEAKKAAKLCIINALAQLKSELGTLDRIIRIIKVSGFVNSTPEFTKQPYVINAASDFLYEVFGEKGKHSRIAVGVASLPLDSMVEIDMIVEIS
jgi:enamine deaminase RidA (YjgF/YER057c/UK114 family)